ncbi:hypothetical protein M097_0678 [Phocaeicola vulgatus str. 3775 SL(B) 10 (iv)]|uniref:Uncharacterized protein n=1 Tax=Phocaeicola vulgatus str. 3775 SL(B) 10 (iv) TaxID=1339350 RepID=A0A078RDM0_PHOVU|nr:hypothetical protein M097_0678 [Phocaeicola vulgatus str. 3775 SL(B) 10 (iv)]
MFIINSDKPLDYNLMYSICLHRIRKEGLAFHIVLLIVDSSI